MRSFALPDLQAFTRAGGRKMEPWLRRLKWVACPFDDAPRPSPTSTRRTNSAHTKLEISPVTSLARQFRPRRLRPETALNADLGRQLILDAVSPISGIEHIPLRDALGRVLAQPVISPIDVPAHDNSAMDGYGLRGEDLAADGDTVLDIIGSAFAGQGFDGSVGPGQAVRIMTGAPCPPASTPW
jgi:molybdopterin molybdotransferase